MFNKITGFGLQDTAVSYYRIIQPLRAMKREGLTKESRILPWSGNNQFQAFAWQPKLYTELCDGADILWTTLIVKTDDLQRVLNLREQYKLKWVVDMDDNMFDVSRDNPEAGAASAAKRYIERCLSLADGITVSVPSLKKLYSGYNDNVYVMPNGVDFYKPIMGNDPVTGKGEMKPWEELRLLKKKKNKKIRIGWEGAYGHRADLDLVLPVIKRLQEDYDITFVVFGWSPLGIKCEWHDWVEFAEYPKKLASLNLDIGIAPLTDSGYNRCKSNLRYLEYSALGIPTVLTPTENQKGMVALEASSPYEWYNQLESLILDAKLRKELGEKANQFVKENYDVRKIVHPLADWFEKLPRREDIAPDKLKA